MTTEQQIDNAKVLLEKSEKSLLDIAIGVHIPANVPSVLSGATGNLQKALRILEGLED